MIYKVELVGRSHEVMGLVCDPYKDTILIYHYPAGDVDTRMRDAGMMFNALYDLFQCHDLLKDGDEFQTEFGNFKCEGIHVVPMFDMP
jgi:hypothetical protein